MICHVACCLSQGLLAGSNDFEQLQKGGDCRDINRHYYTLQEARQAVRRPVVQVRMAIATALRCSM
jgi:sucrose phosphorylase